MNKLFNKIATITLGLAMAIGVGVAAGSGRNASTKVSAAPGSTLKTYDTTSSTFSTGYQRQSGDNFVWFGQKGFFGANNGTNHGNFKPTAADLPVVKAQNSSATTSTTGLYYCYTSEAVANVGSMSIYLSAKSGSSTVNAYVVSSSTAASSGSATWTKVTLSSTSTYAQGANVATAATYTFTFNTTETSSKYYGFVFSTSSYWRATNFNMKLIEGTIPATGISLNKNSTTIAPGSSETLTATVTPSNATDKTVSWSVSPTGQGVTVSNGTVSTTAAATPGEYTVTASANGGTNITATCTVTVESAAAESIAVTGTSSVYVGDAGISLTATPSNFSPSSYTWNSSKTDVATVSGTGSTCSISALAKGTTNITASATGSSGTVISNAFTLTVKQFSIALSTSSVSMKASKSTTVTVTPTDATGTVVVTATSNNTSVATTSVSGTTITINSGSEGGVSTTITVSAKDNNGASGYHTAANQTINVEVTGGYVVGNKITALPSSDKFVFLGNAGKTNWVGSNGATLSTETSDSNAAIFIFSTAGTLRYYDESTQQAGNYIYNGGTNTTVSMSATSAAWASGLSDSDYPGLLQLSGGRFLLFSSGIKAYAEVNKTAANAPSFIYAYEAIASTPKAVLNNDSISGMKGNSDTSSLTLTISNFTPTGLNVTYKDSGESSFSGSSSIASVSCGHASGSNAVSVDFTGVGSTTVKLSVTRGTGNPIEATFTVTVAAKPASMTIVHSDISEGHLEIETSKSKDVSFSGQDTDGNAYAIAAADVTASVQSGASYVSVSGTRITGTAVGSGVVRYTLKALTSVYAEVTIDVRDNYKTTVNTITVINNAEVEQGDTLDISTHISVKTANTHFGPTTTIADNELLFSYTNNRAAAVIYSNFVYEVVDTTLDAGETETRTIYVFVTFDENYAGTSFTAVIEVIDRPVVGLLVDGESVNPGDSIPLSIPRNSTYNLGERITVDPTNATESHQIDYSITSGASIISINAAGIITVGSKTGSAIISATSHANSDYFVYFIITVTREAMTITADVPTTGWALATSIEVGDEVVIVNSTDNAELSGVSSNIGTATSYDGSPARTYVLTVGEGVDGGFTFSNNGNYLAYTSTATTKNNNLFLIANPSTSDEWEQVSWTVDFYETVGEETIAEVNNVYNTSRYLQYNSNSGQERFCGYTGSLNDISFYKEQSGTEPQEVTVTNALFNVVNGAMSLKSGSTTLYDLDLCDATGDTFNTSAWTTLGNQFTAAIKSDNKLAYARADENGNEIEQFLAVYDFVVRKYGVNYDFLGRVESGKIVLSGHTSLLSMMSANTSTAAIVIIVSVVSIAAIGGYFFLRRKKEQ